MDKQFDHLTTTQLLERLRQGDEQIFKWLYTQYWQKLYRAAYKRLKDGPLCEEIVQDIFASLWRRRSTFQLSQSWEAYFYKAVQYKVINAVSSQKVRKAYISTVTKLEADLSTENTLRFEELLHRIEQVTDRLPQRCQQVFWMSRRENFTIREISQQLDISQKAVEKQLTKALKQLRFSLQDYL
ncbi:RNA polymerase sigma-70 factor [Rhodocytophaga rosea]|uniref:RNA polymerase sigma-70 factor n=1 Tax=Rhodocytophaga rosea TaxID=2704465 RepID=A0A6C0GMG5_9BACT|nr:RNA polymerase sigma-70 factor [Rhodocytophaga rosea]QHT68792.1 RNA polymerase sigma-70 factor [Rhodocytophaga rosea]